MFSQKKNDIHGELSEVEASDFMHTIKNKQWVRTSIRTVKNDILNKIIIGQFDKAKHVMM